MLVQLTEKNERFGAGSRVVMAVAPAIMGGGGGVYEMQRRVARPVVESVMIRGDERRRNEAAKLSAPVALVKTTWSRVASVEVKGSQDLVKKIVEIERSRNPKG